MAEIVLFAVFLGAGSYTFLMVWRKIPLLLQVPQQLIEESFVTRPSTLKRYTEPVIVFFRDGRHKELYYATLVRVLHWVRLTLLRLERVVFHMLESLHQRSERLTATEEHYWSELKTWKHEGKKNGNGHIP
ncbi:MAG: hypothetical protein Q8R35_00885, partial [bacterium]|nr:hypothetical protein [bacterium]